jgi:drug/metabolite transporter (DMT)-like permease
MHSSVPYLGEGLSILAAILWAFAVIFFRKSGETVHPLALNVFKNLLALGLFLSVMALFGEYFLQPFPARIYFVFILSGVIGIGIGDTLYFSSLNLLGASLNSIAVCAYSPSIICLSVLFLGESLTIMQIGGVVLITTAVVIATYEKKKKTVERKNLLLGIIIATLSALSTAIGVVMIKPLLSKYPLIWLTEIRLIGGLLVLGLILLFYPNRERAVNSLKIKHGWFYTINGSFFGAFLAMIIWLASIKYTQASIASALHETSVIFIFIFAGIFLKEPINLRRSIGITLAFIGSFLVSFG